MDRETQCKLYQSLTIVGVVLLIGKACAVNCPMLGLGEPVHFELNTHAMEEEYKKTYDIPEKEWMKDEETGKWKQVWVS